MNYVRCQNTHLNHMDEGVKKVTLPVYKTLNNFKRNVMHTHQFLFFSPSFAHAMFSFAFCYITLLSPVIICKWPN